MHAELLAGLFLLSCWVKAGEFSGGSSTGVKPCCSPALACATRQEKDRKRIKEMLQKKKVLGIALCQGLMRKVQGFLSKLLNFIMCGGKYLSPCLYFSSVHQGTVKFLVFFCQRLG